MSDFKRYGVDHGYEFESEKGEYVLHTDYQAEKARIKELENKLLTFEGSTFSDYDKERIEELESQNRMLNMKMMNEHSASLRVEKLEQDNKDHMIKTKAVIDYCYNHLEQMWAARAVSLLLGCDFRDAKFHANKFYEVCEENGL